MNRVKYKPIGKEGPIETVIVSQRPSLRKLRGQVKHHSVKISDRVMARLGFERAGGRYGK